jgi:DNA polymerase
MKKAINNYLNQYKEVYNKELFLDNSVKIKKKPVFLQEYYNEIKDCLKCDLGKTRKNFVFGVGNPNSNIVFVGEAPGKNEDLIGEPFVGRSGKLLDKILGAVNLSRDKVFILNVIKCRPPENRAPNSSEIEKCEPYLKKQLKIIKPKLIVALGRVSAMTLLKTKESLGDMRNKIHKYENIDLMVTYHPAALLRNPNLKGSAWEDFKYIKKEYIDVK